MASCRVSILFCTCACAEVKVSASASARRRCRRWRRRWPRPPPPAGPWSGPRPARRPSCRPGSPSPTGAPGSVLATSWATDALSMTSMPSGTLGIGAMPAGSWPPPASAKSAAPAGPTPTPVGRLDQHAVGQGRADADGGHHQYGDPLAPQERGRTRGARTVSAPAGSGPRGSGVFAQLQVAHLERIAHRLRNVAQRPFLLPFIRSDEAVGNGGPCSFRCVGTRAKEDLFVVVARRLVYVGLVLLPLLHYRVGKAFDLSDLFFLIAAVFLLLTRHPAAEGAAGARLVLRLLRLDPRRRRGVLPGRLQDGVAAGGRQRDLRLLRAAVDAAPAARQHGADPGGHGGLRPRVAPSPPSSPSCRPSSTSSGTATRPASRARVPSV